MQLLHTADLHLGKRVHEFSMLPLQAEMLAQILTIAEENQVDGILLSGDIYDKSVPPEEAVDLFSTFLTALHQRQIAVYCISGNHDSAPRLSFGQELFTNASIYMAGTFHGTVQSVTAQDAYGEVVLYLLPFVKPATVRPFYETPMDSYEEAIRTILHHTKVDTTKRNLLLAHQFVTANGTEPERSDSEQLSIGGVEQIDYSVFSAFDYVALGHLHGPQKVGRDTVRYPGSPLKYSFSECRQKKSVTLLTLREKGDLTIEQIPLTPSQTLRELTGSLEELLKPEMLLHGNPMDYLHITLTDEILPYDALGQLRAVYPNVMLLDYQRLSLPEIQVQAEEAIFKEQTPLEQFSAFYQSVHGTEMTQAEAETFSAILQELEETT